MHLIHHVASYDFNNLLFAARDGTLIGCNTLENICCKKFSIFSAYFVVPGRKDISKLFGLSVKAIRRGFACVSSFRMYN